MTTEEIERQYKELSQMIAHLQKEIQNINFYNDSYLDYDQEDRLFERLQARVHEIRLVMDSYMDWDEWSRGERGGRRVALIDFEWVNVEIWAFWNEYLQETFTFLFSKCRLKTLKNHGFE